MKGLSALALPAALAVALALPASAGESISAYQACMSYCYSALDLTAARKPPRNCSGERNSGLCRLLNTPRGPGSAWQRFVQCNRICRFSTLARPKQ